MVVRFAWSLKRVHVLNTIHGSIIAETVAATVAATVATIGCSQQWRRCMGWESGGGPPAQP